MTNIRSIAFDATFMILYIGLSAGVILLSLTLLGLLALGYEFGPLQIAAAAVIAAGWILLPFGPKLYQHAVGQPFSWRANGALGGSV
jgi:hypothetical protein